MPLDNNTVSGFIDDTAEITPETIASPEQHERRQHPRRAARWACVLTTQSKQVLTGRTRDVSERGASVSTQDDIKFNTRIILEISAFYNGSKKNFRVIAQVKHSSVTKDGFNLGLYFKDASESTLDFLRKYVNRP